LSALIAEQSARLIHASNLYQIAEQERAAEKLAKISGMDAVFFCNSGCEANEARSSSRGCTATARHRDPRHRRHGQGLPRPDPCNALGHGQQEGADRFEPLVSGFVRVQLNDIEAVRRIAREDGSVVAVLVEPIQGEGGINLTTMQYLRDLREVCDRQGWLLMVDEVQCGLGRTASGSSISTPDRTDVVLLAKGLASGVPIGACLARGRGVGVQAGTHGSTFGGNPLACAAALATLAAIEDEA